jgi:hypothetical protein
MKFKYHGVILSCHLLTFLKIIFCKEIKGNVDGMVKQFKKMEGTNDTEN